MAKMFLQVDKDLLGLGLKPLEILVLAQIMEFVRNTGDCFMSDDKFAELFGVTERTIGNTMGALEEKGWIIRETKNKKGGKNRHIKLSTEKFSLDASSNEKISLAQQKNFPLDNGKNFPIKDNIKDNSLKDNSSIEPPMVPQSTLKSAPEAKVKEVISSCGCSEFVF